MWIIWVLVVFCVFLQRVFALLSLLFTFLTLYSYFFSLTGVDCSVGCGCVLPSFSLADPFYLPQPSWRSIHSVLWCFYFFSLFADPVKLLFV